MKKRVMISQSVVTLVWHSIVPPNFHACNAWLHDNQEYIHRLGRTGRAGAKGRGLLLLHDFERGETDHYGLCFDGYVVMSKYVRSGAC